MKKKTKWFTRGRGEGIFKWDKTVFGGTLKSLERNVKTVPIIKWTYEYNVTYTLYTCKLHKK